MASAQSPAPSVAALVAPSPRLAAHVPSHAERLRERLARMPVAAAGARDPFRFSSGGGTPRTAAAPHAAPADVQAGPPPTRLAAPDLRLLGITEDTVGTEIRRTAILSGMNQLFLVKEGEQLALRYQVTKVSADVVEIEDLAENRTLRLALR
jgi:hypothetical protein